MATVGSTYAWFTVSQDTEVNGVNLNVTAAENLGIMALDSTATYVNTPGGDAIIGTDINLAVASNYKATLGLADLQAADYLPTGTGTEWRLQPATAINPDYATIDGSTLSVISLTDGSLTATTDFNNNTGYAVELKFWMYSQSEDTYNIQMNNFDITTNATGALADVVNAVRLSVWAGESGAFAGPQTPTTANIFGLDKDYNFQFPTAENGGGLLAEDTLDEVATALTTGTALNQTSAAAAANQYTKTDADSGVNIFTLAGNTPTLVTVLIYLEGWDASTVNDIALSDFDITFGFGLGTVV
jgi:hypothetical protein